MNWLDYVFLGLNAITYALGHYHGHNRGVATAGNVLNQYLPQAQAVAESDPQAGAAGASAGAAAYAAGKR